MLIRFLVLFICLCAGSASGAVEELTLGTIVGGFNDFDSSGAASTKTIALNDDDNTTYIVSTAVNDIDRYEVADVTATDIDEIDSVVIIGRAREASSGNNKIQFQVQVNTGVSAGSQHNLTTTWTTYSSSFGTHPEGGAWTEGGLDSLRTGVVAAKHASANWVDSVRIFVYYKSDDRTLMFPEKDDACLTTGAGTFDHDLLRKSAMQNDTGFIQVPDLTANKSAFWKTGNAVTEYHKMNNDDWETGGFGVFLDVVHVKSDCSLKVRIQRYNSSCVLQESTPFYPASGAELLIDTTGHYEFQIPQHDWSSGACGDELVVDLSFSNNGIGVEDSIWIRYGVADTYFEHEIVINKGGCPAGQASGDCANTVTMNPGDEGFTNTWVEVGSAGGKWEAMADAVDANYDSTFTEGNNQAFNMTGFAEPADFLTYDSIHFEFRASRTGAKKNVKVRLRIYDSTNTSNYCESLNINIRNVDPTWVDFNTQFSISGTPSGEETCEGVMTEAQIEKIEIEFRANQIDQFKSMRITKAQLIICYTTTGGAPAGQVIRIQLGMKDPLPEWERKWWEGIDHPLYPNRGLVWGVTKDSKRWRKKCDCDKHS